MDSRRRALIKSGTLAIGLSYLSQPSNSQSKLRLSGEVLNKDNMPVPAPVTVTAYRRAVKIGESTTGVDGKYSIDFDAGPPISTVKYERTNYFTGEINDLCGTRNHSISKTLYLRTKNLEPLEGQEVLAALERVYYIETLNGVLVARLKDTYGAMLLDVGKYLPDRPVSLKDRLTAVLKLYQLA